MNRPIRSPLAPHVTQAADGLPRRAFTVAEVEAMVAAGVIDADERFEMIGGEIVPMTPKSARHEWVKRVLNRFFQRAAPDALSIAPETTLRLDDHSFVEPDFCVFASGLGPHSLDATRVLLAVEVSDTSLVYDLGRKIGIYAAYGIREVWVIDALTLATRVYRRLGAEGYADRFDVPSSEPVVPMLAPELAVTLARLGLTPVTD